MVFSFFFCHLHFLNFEIWDPFRTHLVCGNNFSSLEYVSFEADSWMPRKVVLECLVDHEKVAHSGVAYVWLSIYFDRKLCKILMIPWIKEKTLFCLALRALLEWKKDPKSQSMRKPKTYVSYGFFFLMKHGNFIPMGMSLFNFSSLKTPTK